MTTDRGPTAKAELEIHRHFAGKRDGRRVERQLEVVLRVAGNAFVAESIDISRSGILLRMESGFADQGVDLPYFALQVQCFFADGCEALMNGHDVPIRAQLVRATEKHGYLLIAFRFDKPLSKKACKALGVPSKATDEPNHSQE